MYVYLTKYNLKTQCTVRDQKVPEIPIKIKIQSLYFALSGPLTTSYTFAHIHANISV